MNHSIKELKAVFTNGNELSLVINECHFAGFKPANVWQLSYGERNEGNYSDDAFSEPTPGDHYFMACNTEYFPESNTDLAIASFVERSTSINPGEYSGNGLRLESFLEVKPLVPVERDAQNHEQAAKGYQNTAFNLGQLNKKHQLPEYEGNTIDLGPMLSEGDVDDSLNVSASLPSFHIEINGVDVLKDLKQKEADINASALKDVISSLIVDSEMTLEEHQDNLRKNAYKNALDANDKAFDKVLISKFGKQV